MFNQQELLKTFIPLSQGGNLFLEVLLINPASQKIEGRGFFNDPDFLIEACTPLAGRWNFCLSPYAYLPESLPSRQGYNQFDRSLVDSSHQEKGHPHSFSLSFQFKPEMWRELETQGGGNPVLHIVYLVDGILGRIPLKTFLLEYGGHAMTARFVPAVASQIPLQHPHFLDVTRKLLERVEKEMYPEEHKKLGLASTALGTAWDLLPGTPISSGSEEPPSQLATTAGQLAVAEEPLFQKIFEEVLEGKKSRTSTDIYAPANLQGLSQGWEEPNEDALMLGARVIGGAGLMGAKAPPPLTASQDLNSDPLTTPSPSAHAAHLGHKASPHAVNTPGHASHAHGSEGSQSAASPSGSQSNEERLKQKQLGEIAQHFQQVAASRWHWPLVSQAFHRLWKGPTAGQILLLQCDPFGAESGFQFLMQCADTHARETGAQTVVFSKPHHAGDIALLALARQLKQNPLAAKDGQGPNSEALARQYLELFPQAPLIPPCAPSDNWDHLLRYLEHDYMVRQKKSGTGLQPLCIVVDNATEFQSEAPEQTYRQLSHFKARLRDFNATLWILQPLAEPQKSTRELLTLTDYLATLDFEGAFSNDTGDREGWEFSFPLDPQIKSGAQDIALVRVTFQAHGNHRQAHSTYAHLRQAGLFRELVNPPQAGQAASTAAPRAANPQAAPPSFTAVPRPS